MNLAVRFFGIFLMFSTAAIVASDHAELPSAEEVMIRYIEAIGGEKAVKSIKSSRWKGTYLISPAQDAGTFERYFLAPDKGLYIGKDAQRRRNRRIVYNGPYGGFIRKTEEGTEYRWVTPVEARRFMRSVNVATFLYPKEVFESVFNVGTQTVNGELCYRIQIRQKGLNRRINAFFSVETGLLVQESYRMKPPVDDPGTRNSEEYIHIRTLFSNYVEKSGILAPMVETTISQNYSVRYSVESIEYNLQFNAGLFAIPQEIINLPR